MDIKIVVLSNYRLDTLKEVVYNYFNNYSLNVYLGNSCCFENVF